MKFNMYKGEKRIVDNRADTKRVLPSTFYAVGVDKKGKSFIGVFENVSNVTAKALAKKWAKKEELALQTVQAFK